MKTESLLQDRLIEFFSQPGINKSGICEEAGISQQHLNRVLRGSQRITDAFLAKLLPVLRSYGFED